MTLDDAGRWAQVEALLGAALELGPQEREQLLDESCTDDPELRREVSTLLAAHDRTGAFDGLAANVAPLGARLRWPSAPPAADAVIGRYRVVAPVAGGGMGIVYKAVDEHLGRTVALKFLHAHLGADDSAAERFRHEARAIASLEHPNVCTVHEIGETTDGQLYFAMPLYHGETLQQRIARGPLPLDEALRIAVQIARGLAKAHARGIVHRDIKPSNVFVTDDGVVKILDFGIAKLADVTVTGPAGGPLGTVAYMSPEQLHGAPVDRRSDLWALGVVTYEMLTGTRPFGGSDAAAVRAGILEREPAAPSARRGDVPPAVDQLVMRALAKSPDARHDSARAFEQDVMSLGIVQEVAGVALLRDAAPSPGARWRGPRWRRLSRRARVVVGGIAATIVALSLGGVVLWRAERARAPVASATVAPEPSVVVLPLVNVQAPGGDEYLSDGITEEIITRLALVPGLKVISRTSAMHYKRSTAPLQRIASDLHVGNLLTGSIRQGDGRLHIAVQLIDGKTGVHRWASTYDTDPRDQSRVEEEIARQVVGALDVEPGGAKRALAGRGPRGTRDPEAYALYRRGRFLWGKRTKAAHQQAIDYYQRAIERDSTYAEPYAGLADAYLTAYQFNLSTTPEAEVYSRIKWAAERALALDDQSAAAHASFAMALWWQQNWPGAERELRRTLELDPSHGARGWYAQLLSGMGRMDEAVEQARLSSELDPLGVLTGANHAWLCYLARDFDCAIEQAQHALELNDRWAIGYADVSLSFSQKGMHDEAMRSASKAVELGGPQVSAFLATAAYVYARAGRRAEAEQFLRRAKATPWEGFNIARAYVALGERDSAFAWLDRSSWKWPHRAVRADPALDPLRADPRFARLSQRIDREMGL